MGLKQMKKLEQFLGKEEVTSGVGKKILPELIQDRFGNSIRTGGFKVSIQEGHQTVSKRFLTEIRPV
jgi:hypothetical protein